MSWLFLSEDMILKEGDGRCIRVERTKGRRIPTNHLVHPLKLKYKEKEGFR